MTLMAYHVLHEGRRMGPYDRRTIVGLRIKKTLTSAHELEASDGSRLTVAELLGRQPTRADFSALRSGAYTAAKLTCSACLVDSEPGPVEILPFSGEIELRLHPDLLRIAGTYRTGRSIKEGRVKLPLKDIAYIRHTGSRVDLWLRADAAAGGGLQRLALDLFSEDAVRDLLQGLPEALPWPEEVLASSPLAPAQARNVSLSPLLWAAVIGIAMVAGLVLLVVLRRRF